MNSNCQSDKSSMLGIDLSSENVSSTSMEAETLSDENITEESILTDLCDIMPNVLTSLKAIG